MSNAVQYLFDDERDRLISRRFRWFIVGSVIFHLLTLGSFTAVDRMSSQPKVEKVLKVSFRDDPAATNPAPQPPAQTRIAPLPPFASRMLEMLIAPIQPQPAPESHRKTIVELMEANQVAPEAADYLSEYNNRTDRETSHQGEGGQDGSLASNSHEPAGAVLIPPVPGPKAEEPQPESEARPPASEAAPQPSPPPPQSPPPGRLSPPSRTQPLAVASNINPDGNHVPALWPDSPLSGRRQAEDSGTSGTGPGRPSGLTRRDLMLNPSDLAAIDKDQAREKDASAGGAPAARPGQMLAGNLMPGRRGSIEDLRHVSPGDLTVLNSFASKYAGFYNTMNRLIFFHWSDYVENAFKIVSDYNPEYLGPGSHDLITQLRFVLDKDGKVLRKEVVKSCGVPRVDDFAMQSVRLAAPYPGVPAELLDEKGELSVDLGFRISRQ